MSHFTVLVIGENPEKQLAPYHEYECTGKDDEYIQEIDKYQEKFEEYKTHEDISIMSFEDYLKENGLNEKTGDKVKDKWGYYVKDKDGKVVSVINRTNPNYKWDWYVIGGRWAGFFKLKKGKEGILGEPSLVYLHNEDYKNKYNTTTKVDQAKKGDIDFSPEEEVIIKAKRFWEIYIEGDKPQNKEEEELIKFQFYKKEYYTEHYRNKEDYIKRIIELNTYAVVKDGKWFEKGKMGWFGCSSETHEEAKEWEDSFYDKWIKDLPDDTLLTLVDCHI